MEIFLQAFSELGNVIKLIWQAAEAVWFIILPLALWFLFKTLWLDFVQKKFSDTIGNVLLEIVPPRDIEKSPKIMESIYSGMSGILKGFTAFETYLEGMYTFSFSLEIVSDGGKVHFYIHTPVIFQHLVEAHIYAQYPNAEIHEVPDYVDQVPKVIPSQDWNLWGTDFELVKDDPYPIKTYRSFEEDITGTMIDPLAGLIEAMGKLPPDQKIWLQYVITPEKESWQNTGQALIDKLAGKAKPKPKGILAGLISEIGDIITNIPKGFAGPVEFKKKEEAAREDPIEFRLTSGEKEVLKALENNVSKNVFKTKMRFLYLGKRENFNITFVSSFLGGIKQFTDLNLNSFKPNSKSKTTAEYLLADMRKRYRQRKIFDRYKYRSSRGQTFILSTEELATVFHLPDISVMAPAFSKVEAKRGGAPGNLPVQ